MKREEWTHSEVLKYNREIKNRPHIKCEECGKMVAMYVNKGRLLCKRCEYIAIQQPGEKAE